MLVPGAFRFDFNVQVLTITLLAKGNCHIGIVMFIRGRNHAKAEALNFVGKINI